MTRTAAAILLALGFALLAFGAWSIHDTYQPRAPIVLPADHVMPPP